MSQAERERIEEERERERRHQLHSQTMQMPGEGGGKSAQILQELSQIDDLPMNPQDDPVMGQLISKLTSTANLTPDEVRSNEWVREYILILYLCQFPTPDGCHGSWRAWAHGDDDQEREPLQPEMRMKLETLVTTSKLALSRSRDAKVIEEGTRDVKETYVNDGSGEEGSGSGILGKIGIR